MRTTQLVFRDGEWEVFGPDNAIAPQLCLVFGSRMEMEDLSIPHTKLLQKYGDVTCVAASTAGNILDEQLFDETITVTCIEFEKTEVKAKLFLFDDFTADELGSQIAHSMMNDDLAYLLLLSTVGINAGKVLDSINTIIDGKVPVSGGVAGDDSRFEKTLVGLNDNIGESRIVAVGFYGDQLETRHGSKGGWDTFGPSRTVTKCDGNILYEIDGKPALDLYKTYLGEKASELPGSGLYFPIAIIDPESQEYIVRGLQNVDEANKALILFSDMHEGDSIQLMRANFDRVIDGSGISASEASFDQKNEADLAILISCVARRLVLNQLTEEELVEAKDVLGDETTICGFYSYSEMSPIVGDKACHLHNQTMTITTLREI